MNAKKFFNKNSIINIIASLLINVLDIKDSKNINMQDNLLLLIEIFR